MSKELEALERIKREAGIPHFSSLYDIDMWKEDFATVETTLKKQEQDQEKQAFEIIKNRFDFRVLDDGKNYFLEVGYLWGKKWAFTGRRIPNRKELAICKKALGIKKSHKKKFSKSRGVYYECSPIYEENLKLKKVLDIIKEKCVDVGLFVNCSNVRKYNNAIRFELYNHELTQEEFDLIKEVLL